MKIAFIVNGFPTLSETFILDQITGLLDRGHEVDIYADRRRDEPLVHADVKKYNLRDRAWYLHTDGAIPTNKIRRLGGGLARIIGNFQKAPMAVLSSLNVLKFGREAASLSILYQITPFVRKGPYDIVHCQFGPNGILGTILRDRHAFQGKVVTTFRGYDISAYPRTNGSNVYRDLFEKGDLFLCVSERIRDKLIKFGCHEGKILLHRSGVDTKKFAFVPRNPKIGDKVRILTIARLIEVKGVWYGIEAVAKLLKKYGNIEYQIAGDGPLRESLQGVIEDQRVGNEIKLIGWKSRDEIVELLGASDILLAPSVTSQRGEEEGLPGVVREAFARGLAVVSTRYGGIPEIVEDGVSGFLVPERDVDALAERLEYLIQHPKVRTEMGRAGRHYVEQHYDIEKWNDRLVDVYEQLLRT